MTERNYNLFEPLPEEPSAPEIESGPENVSLKAGDDVIDPKTKKPIGKWFLDPNSGKLLPDYNIKPVSEEESSYQLWINAEYARKQKIWENEELNRKEGKTPLGLKKD